MKNVLIVEDHPLVAEATKSLFLTLEVDSVDICKSAEEAVTKLNECHDWFRVFLDIGVPGANGLSLIRYVKGRNLAERSAVITAIDDSQWRVEVEAMGFLGYILKTVSVEEFGSAVQKIIDGDYYFNEKVGLKKPTHLTQRQLEILGLMHDGLSSKHIAKYLRISPGTVDNHVGAIIKALRVNDRTHAVAKGISLGYVGQHVGEPQLLSVPKAVLHAHLDSRILHSHDYAAAQCVDEHGEVQGRTCTGEVAEHRHHQL